MADDATTTITPTDLAELWGTDPKTVRRFLRANTEARAGKGGRWVIDEADAEALTEAFNSRGTTKKFVMKADENHIPENGTGGDEVEYADEADELEELEELDVD